MCRAVAEHGPVKTYNFEKDRKKILDDVYSRKESPTKQTCAIEKIHQVEMLSLYYLSETQCGLLLAVAFARKASPTSRSYSSSHFFLNCQSPPFQLLNTRKLAAKLQLQRGRKMGNSARVTSPFSLFTSDLFSAPKHALSCCRKS